MLLLLACKVVEAPQSLGELMNFGFLHHSEVDPAWGEAFVTNLQPELESHAAELEEGYRSNNLTVDELGGLGISSGNEVPGVIAKTTLKSSLDDVVAALSFSDMTEVFSATTEYEVLEKSDKSCFLSEACEFYTYRATRTIDLGILGQATQVFDGSFRWTETEAGERAVMWQTVAPDEAETTGVVTLFQQYSMDLLMAEGTGTLRVGAIWLDAELAGATLSESLLVSTSVTQMKNAAEDIDAFVSEAGR